MQTKNYIFQIQNAIYKTISQGNFGVEIVLNRGLNVPYPHIIITGTKKTTTQSLQTMCITEIQLNTKDVSLAQTVEILAKIEEILTLEKIRNNINFYSLNFAQVLSSEITTNDDGNFCGRLYLQTIVD